jgi:dihydrodiol dehydrogenase / D-xylose 1-dehydrogenase (NADP)
MASAQKTSAKIRWGILGAGLIAHKLAEAVQLNPDCQLIAVASKTPEKAQDFAKQYHISACQDYAELVQRTDIDIIYVATTHNFHFENTQLALNHGKHCLVEKPFTVNAHQAEQLIQLAKQKNLFLMEAIWVRFLPSMIELKNRLQQNAIGKIQLFNLTFGAIAPEKYLPRLTTPELAGGVTLDMGIYPITFINFLLDQLPQKINSLCHFSSTGVDETALYQFAYPSGCMANINTSYNLHTRMEAIIYGSLGYIEFPNFQQGNRFTIHTHQGTSQVASSQTVEVQNHNNGFIYQVAEVVKQIRNNALESPVISLQETLDTMALMDGMRKSWGFVYPFE